MLLQGALKTITAVSSVVCVGGAKANYLRHKRQMPPFLKFTFGERFSVPEFLICQCEG
jgi:hypothetical protein